MTRRKLLLFPALAVGVLALVFLVRTATRPLQKPAPEPATSVRVLDVPRLDVLPRALGYGTARPGRVWKAVPQVGGRVVALAPSVREGSFVEEGDALVRIDPSDYELEVKVAEASIAALGAELAETKTREETIRRTLALERESLALAETEVERIRSLVERQSLPPADLDREQRTLLAQRLKVTEIENALALLEPTREVLEARRAQETARLERARLSVVRTTISAPFDARIGPVSVEREQVVQPGQVLFQADATATTEVTAWLPMVGLRQLLTGALAEGEALDVFEADEELPAKLGLSATVRLRAAGREVTWPAKVVRVRGVDSRTRAVGIDVAVEDPYERVVPVVRPPLQRGMYVEVEIRGARWPDAVVIPRAALHEDQVYLVGTDRRLERRDVALAFVQSSFAVVERGLEGGETLVLSDLVPAVGGMLLDPQADEAALAALRSDATGEERAP